MSVLTVAAVLAAALERADGDRPRTFWTTPGRSSSIRWASQLARPSPRRFLISFSPDFVRPVSVGEPTPTASNWAGSVCGSRRRT